MTTIKHEQSLDEMTYAELASLYNHLAIIKPMTLVSNNSIGAELFAYIEERYNTFVKLHPDKLNTAEHQNLAKYYDDINEMKDDFENGRKLDKLYTLRLRDKFFYVDELSKDDLIDEISNNLFNH